MSALAKEGLSVDQVFTENLDLERDKEPAFKASLARTLKLKYSRRRIDAAGPFGLVFHELVSNAFRHAYSGGALGEVRVSLRQAEDGRVGLAVADDGAGLPAGLDPVRPGTIGLRLARGLVEDQLRGALSFESSGGLTCRVSFTGGPGKKRI
jgi:two-component sensor histidine kinase